MSASPLARAKSRLSIPELWQLRSWPGKSGKSCVFPNGTDKRPSASVFAEGRLLKDFRSGKTYDGPALLAEVEGLTPEAACRLFIQHAGVRSDDPPAPLPVRRPAPESVARVKPDLERLRLSLPSESESLALGKLRQISTAAVREAVARGFLWCSDSREGRAWVMRDGAGWVAVARRIDGKGWECISGAKARLLKGSRASWPLGIEEASTFPAIALVEGGPDFLAAFYFILEAGAVESVAPVAMLGAGMALDAEALPFFRGKRVRVFIDDDAAGKRAFARWSEQLASVQAVVDGFNFSGLIRDNGEPAKDLNDCTSLSPISLARWGSLLSSMMQFAPRKEASPAPELPPPPVTLSGWWNGASCAAIQGTEIEGDGFLEELARFFSARVILPEWKQNLEELKCPS